MAARPAVRIHQRHGGAGRREAGAGHDLWSADVVADGSARAKLGYRN